MSHVLAIGIESQAISDELTRALGDAGFEHATLLRAPNPLLTETVSAARSHVRGLEWFVAVRDGDVDLDRIYCFAGWSEAGPFKTLLERIASGSGLSRVGVWIYDLSDHEVEDLPKQPLNRLVDALTRSYQAGGPIGSAYHEFEQ